MIIDCFPFFNEFDQLEIHLETTAAVVDRYVIVESNRTFRGTEKPYNLHKARDRYSRFWHKVHYQPIASINHSDPWKNEEAERNQLFEIVARMGWATAGNTILLVDVDEVPRPEAILRFQQSQLELANLKMPIFNYYYNLQVNDRWRLPKILRGSSVRPAHALRIELEHPSIEDAGWHFSNVMTPELLRLKHQSFSHSERDKEEFLNLDTIREAMKNGEDLFRLGKEHFDPVQVPISTLPPFLQKNRERFASQLLPES